MSYSFIETFKDDDYMDFDIYDGNNLIGKIQLVVSNYIFIRHITILKQYRRKGHATKIVDYILYKYNRPVKLCISTISTSAQPFWENYFSTKKYVNHIRGNIYEIIQ